MAFLKYLNYVSDEINHNMQKFDSNGKFISKWSSRGNGEGQFNVPSDLVVRSTYAVYVSDGSNHRIQGFCRRA
jgi:tripartite motif-containing protein 71